MVDKKMNCSFCGKSNKEDKEIKLIQGPNDVFICFECAGLCGEIIDEDKPDENENPQPNKAFDMYYKKIRKKDRERLRRWREKKKKSGLIQISIMISKKAKKLLETEKIHSGETQSELIENAIIAQYQNSSEN